MAIKTPNNNDTKFFEKPKAKNCNSRRLEKVSWRSQSV